MHDHTLTATRTRIYATPAWLRVGGWGVRTTTIITTGNQRPICPIAICVVVSGSAPHRARQNTISCYQYMPLMAEKLQPMQQTRFQAPVRKAAALAPGLVAQPE
jgi:hypothetical protein